MTLEIIDKEKFDKADSLEVKKDETKEESTGLAKDMSDERFRELLKKMENPVEAQKELAVQIKNFLDFQIDTELKKRGFLSDFTRRWVKEYNEILDRIQKSLYGDKSISLHYHKVSHAAIAAKVRKYKEVSDKEEKRK